MEFPKTEHYLSDVDRPMALQRRRLLRRRIINDAGLSQHLVSIWHATVTSSFSYSCYSTAQDGHRFQTHTAPGQHSGMGCSFSEGEREMHDGSLLPRPLNADRLTCSALPQIHIALRIRINRKSYCSTSAQEKTCWWILKMDPMLRLQGSGSWIT